MGIAKAARLLSSAKEMRWGAKEGLPNPIERYRNSCGKPSGKWLIVRAVNIMPQMVDRS
jgi:hypothetical protein